MADDYTPTTDESLRLLLTRLRQYVPVDLADQIAADVQDSLWLAAHDAEVAAKAWDEGYRRACFDHSTWCRRKDGEHGQRHINPYRIENGATHD